MAFHRYSSTRPYKTNFSRRHQWYLKMKFRRSKEQLTHINLKGKKKNILLWCRRWIPRREWKCRTIWGSESSGRWPSPDDDRMELSAWNIQIVACYSIRDSMRRRKPFLKWTANGTQLFQLLQESQQPKRDRSLPAEFWRVSTDWPLEWTSPKKKLQPLPKWLYSSHPAPFRLDICIPCRRYY